jgi:AcrR family transcriptional regulator
MAPTVPGPPAGPQPAGTRIAAAARDLFADRGYEQTTVEAIAERAGVGRRTFFRYFRSKDDAIFPDHDQIAAQARALIEALAALAPLRAVCGGARLVFRSYVDDPVVAVERYRLTRSVAALRDRETASVSMYTRLFAGHLRECYPDTPEGVLRAEVGGAAIVAAHNTVLRDWLRAGGGHDPLPALDAAFDWVVTTLEGAPPAALVAGPGALAAPEVDDASPSAAGGPANRPADGEQVVVAVFRAGDPIDDVVRRITRSL